MKSEGRDAEDSACKRFVSAAVSASLAEGHVFVLSHLCKLVTFWRILRLERDSPRSQSKAGGRKERLHPEDGWNLTSQARPSRAAISDSNISNAYS
eukprot:scaffold1307_cov200-Pinguiococcus_pyrenoidosus.AAC.79